MPGPDANEKLLLISFQDVAHPAPGKFRRGKSATPGNEEQRRVEELERELAYTKENLHATIEEQQASNEELKSTNEELQSTNEELQSTNEELETSKEELQSVNEELITVNAELQAKIEQLADMQNDMKNLLDNINIGTVFLDQHLCIKRYTREATEAYRLVASDVGRPLGDIKSNIEGEDLLADAQTVLNTLAPFERKVRTFAGAWYQARIQPYRTLDNLINGVVLTFNDISQLVKTEMAVNEARKLAEGIVDTVRGPLVVLGEDLRVITASRSYYRYFQSTAEATMDQPIYELGNRQWDIPELRNLLENILPGNESFEDFVVEQDFPAIGHRKLLLNARRIVGMRDSKQMILLAMEESA
jgi:two-component system CheB/CheR fusion protein